MTAPAPRTCSTQGCDRAIKARGLCTRHYARMRRSDPARPTCAVEGCDKAAVSLGWCPRHYTRWRRHGSPATVLDGIKHGHCREGSKSSTHHSWDAMISAATRPRDSGYAYIGGRGIGVCGRWRGTDGFSHFVRDMGERPPGRILARIDLDGDFTPENCRWTARKAQYAARRRKRLTPR